MCQFLVYIITTKKDHPPLKYFKKLLAQQLSFFMYLLNIYAHCMCVCVCVCVFVCISTCAKLLGKWVFWPYHCRIWGRTKHKWIFHM